MMLEKRTPIRSKAITQSAKGESCTFNGPTCTRNNEETVFSHVNLYIAGKGKGIKSDDLFGFYACYKCHMFYESNILKPEIIGLLVSNAMIKTQRKLFDKGIIKVME